MVSPSSPHVDEPYGDPVKEIHKRRDLKVDNKKEQFLFDEYDADKSREDNRHTTQGNRVSEKTGYEKTL